MKTCLDYVRTSYSGSIEYKETHTRACAHAHTTSTYTHTWMFIFSNDYVETLLVSLKSSGKFGVPSLKGDVCPLVLFRLEGLNVYVSHLPSLNQFLGSVMEHKDKGFLTHEAFSFVIIG